MTDQWEFYPAQMGDHVAFIFVNVTIGERLAQSGLTAQVLVRITLKHPREDGLTTNEEFDSLSELEDGFSNYCGVEGAEMVGRVTVGGIRDFVVYSDDAEKVCNGLETIARDEHGYAVETLVREDPLFEVYWKHLFPTPVDWQLIQNRQLVEQLDEHGDSCEQPRRIEHWIHFESEVNRDQFEKRVASEGFTSEARIDPSDDEPRHGLRIAREDAPSLAVMNEVTVTLFRLAEEFHGEYDGWETQVAVDSDSEGPGADEAEDG